MAVFSDTALPYTSVPYGGLFDACRALTIREEVQIFEGCYVEYMHEGLAGVN